MGTAAEAIDIVDGLVKAKIPKETAIRLVDYVEKQREKGVDRLWIAIGILAVFMLGGFAWLGGEIKDTRRELKAEMNRRFIEQKAETKELKAEMSRRFAEIKSLLQKR